LLLLSFAENKFKSASAKKFLNRKGSMGKVKKLTLFFSSYAFLLFPCRFSSFFENFIDFSHSGRKMSSRNLRFREDIQQKNKIAEKYLHSDFNIIQNFILNFTD
jgi:hypothetical protein